MDKQQFEAFLEKYRPVLITRAERITGDRDTAEDVVQTTSAYLLKNLHRHDPERCSLLTWVYGAVTRRAFNQLRASGRYLPLLDGFSEECGGLAPGADVVYEEAQKQDLLNRMGEALKDDPAYDLAVKLLEGWNVKGMADLEHITWESMNERLLWAFKRWRRLLARKFTRAEIETALGR